MTADLLTLLDRDPAQGIIAVASVRERLAEDHALEAARLVRSQLQFSLPYVLAEIALDHVLVAVHRWRSVVGRHMQDNDRPVCVHDQYTYPCPDLRETANEARAYLGGAS